MRSRYKLSRPGMELLKTFEGLRTRAARLPDGRWVIGYGHTRSAREGAEVGEADAEALLLFDLIPVVAGVADSLSVEVNPRQFDALVCFAFNVGLDAYRASGVPGLVNAGRLSEAALTMETWRAIEFEGRTVVVDVLVRRRAAEKALFFSAPDEPAPAPSALLKPEVDVRALAGLPVRPPAEASVSLTGTEARLELLEEPDPQAEPTSDPEPEAGPAPETESPDGPALPEATASAVAVLLGEAQPEPPPAEAIDPVAPTEAETTEPEPAAEPATAEPADAPAEPEPAAEPTEPEPVAEPATAEPADAPTEPEPQTGSEPIVPVWPTQPAAEPEPEPEPEPKPPVTPAAAAMLSYRLYSPYPGGALGPLPKPQPKPVPAAAPASPRLYVPGPVGGLGPVEPLSPPQPPAAFPVPEARPESEPEPEPTPAPEPADEPAPDVEAQEAPLGISADAAEPGMALVLTPAPESEPPPARPVWNHRPAPVPEGQSALFQEDPATNTLDRLVIHEPAPAGPDPVKLSEVGAYGVMGVLGLVAWGGAIGGFRLANEVTPPPGALDERTAIAWALAVIGSVCVGVSAYNLLKRMGGASD